MNDYSMKWEKYGYQLSVVGYQLSEEELLVISSRGCLHIFMLHHNLYYSLDNSSPFYVAFSSNLVFSAKIVLSANTEKNITVDAADAQTNSLCYQR